MMSSLVVMHIILYVTEVHYKKILFYHCSDADVHNLREKQLHGHDLFGTVSY